MNKLEVGRNYTLDVNQIKTVKDVVKVLDAIGVVFTPVNDGDWEGIKSYLKVYEKQPFAFGNENV